MSDFGARGRRILAGRSSSPFVAGAFLLARRRAAATAGTGGCCRLPIAGRLIRTVNAARFSTPWNS